MSINADSDDKRNASQLKDNLGRELVNIASEDAIESFKKAGKIAGEALHYGKSLIKKEVDVVSHFKCGFDTFVYFRAKMDESFRLTMKYHEAGQLSVYTPPYLTLCLTSYPRNGKEIVDSGTFTCLIKVLIKKDVTVSN